MKSAALRDSVEIHMCFARNNFLNGSSHYFKYSISVESINIHAINNQHYDTLLGCGQQMSARRHRVL